MNRVELLGRLTKDPDMRQTNGEEPILVARFVLAVERRRRKDGQTETDFISCVAFGKAAEFQKNICIREVKLLLPEEYKQEIILIKMVRKYIPRMWLQRKCILLKAKERHLLIVMDVLNLPMEVVL